MGLFSAAKLFGMTIRESANDGSDFTSPDADYRRLFLGEDGQLHVKDSAGTVTDIGAAVADILDLTTAETDDTLVLGPDGAGGVEFRAEAGGGGGLTHSYAGKNEVGASTEALVALKIYCKKITLAADGFLGSIGAHVTLNTDAGTNLGAALYSDKAGAVGHILAYSAPVQNAIVPEPTNAHNEPAAWMHIPIGMWLPAGDYWIAIRSDNAFLTISYDTGGSDNTIAVSGGNWFADGGRYTTANSTKDYSIRADVLS